MAVKKHETQMTWGTNRIHTECHFQQCPAFGHIFEIISLFNCDASAAVLFFFYCVHGIAFPMPVLTCFFDKTYSGSESRRTRLGVLQNTKTCIVSWS